MLRSKTWGDGILHAAHMIWLACELRPLWKQPTAEMHSEPMQCSVIKYLSTLRQASDKRDVRGGLGALTIASEHKNTRHQRAKAVAETDRLKSRVPEGTKNGRVSCRSLGSGLLETFWNLP